MCVVISIAYTMLVDAAALVREHVAGQTAFTEQLTLHVHAQKPVSVLS